MSGKVPGKGFARQVTPDNLEKLAPLLTPPSKTPGQPGGAPLDPPRPRDPLLDAAEAFFSGEHFRPGVFPVVAGREPRPGYGVPATPSPSMPPSPSGPLPRVARWTKQLSRSDAQRKATGNQRGSITLVQAGHPINAQTYFRNELLKQSAWVVETTHTNERRETATIPFRVNFLGQDLGVLDLMVTHAPNREAAQANYTSLLHLGPLATWIASIDVTGKWLVLDRFADGTFALSVLDAAP